MDILNSLRRLIYKIKVRIFILFITYKKKITLKKLVLDTKSKKILKTLQDQGFVVFRDKNLIKISDQILKYYCPKNQKGFKKNQSFLLEEIISTANLIGNFQAYASFNDKNIQKILFSKKICSIINAYVGVPVFFRENPIIEIHKFQNPAEATRDISPYAVSFHSDYYRQLNIMLLLSDITENDTCTEYAVGSNNRNAFFQGAAIGYPYTNKILNKSCYKIKKITGKKGDIVIMDTTGIHRARVMPDSERKMLIGIVNPNHPFLGYKENITKDKLNKNYNDDLIFDFYKN